MDFTEQHHVIPVSYYKCYYKCGTRRQAEVFASRACKNSVITLSYLDHCRAHWLLYFCTIDQLKYLNDYAVSYIVNVYKKITGEEKPRLAFVQEDFELLQKYMNDIKADTASRYYSNYEIEIVKQCHAEGQYGYILRSAKKLGISVKRAFRIASKCNLNRPAPDWTSTEISILKQYYPLECDSVYKRFPNRTRAVVRAEAVKLKIKTISHYWTEDEERILVQNYAQLGPKAVSKLIPTRTALECRKKAKRLNLSYRAFHSWSKEKEDVLIQNKDLPIAKLEALVGLKSSVVRQKLKELSQGGRL